MKPLAVGDDTDTNYLLLDLSAHARVESEPKKQSKTISYGFPMPRCGNRCRCNSSEGVHLPNTLQKRARNTKWKGIKNRTHRLPPFLSRSGAWTNYCCKCLDVRNPWADRGAVWSSRTRHLQTLPSAAWVPASMATTTMPYRLWSPGTEIY